MNHNNELDCNKDDMNHCVWYESTEDSSLSIEHVCISMDDKFPKDICLNIGAVWDAEHNLCSCKNTLKYIIT